MTTERKLKDVSSFLDAPKMSEIGEEFGVPINLPFSMPYSASGKKLNEIFPTEEDVDEPSVKQLITMRRVDGQARALYRLITLPIRSALRNASFHAPEGGVREEKFIRDMFLLPSAAGGMQTTFSDTIASMLTAVFDGFSVFEQVYNIPKTGKLKGKIVLSKLAYRPSETITFLVDDHGDFAGVRQQTFLNGIQKDIVIPGDRVFRYTAQDEERPFYGVSYFQSAFSHYVKKVKLYYLAHLSAQHRAVGVRIGRVPRGASVQDKTNFKRALADFGVAQAILLPDGFEVETVYPSSSFDYLQLINHHNSQMSKSVLAGFLDESQGGGGTLVDFSQQSDAMFILMLQTIMDEIAEEINTQLIPKFIKWNFPNSEKFPKFHWGTFTDEQRSTITEVFNKLSAAGAGINVTPDFMFELEKRMSEELGFDLDYVRIAKEQKEREEQKALAEARDSQNVSGFESALDSGDASGEGSEITTSEESEESSTEDSDSGTPADSIWAIPDDELPETWNEEDEKKKDRAE